MPDRPKPINFRPSERDRQNLDKIRRLVPWITSDADAFRYALEIAAKKRPAGG